jgi:PAS domain-containing protein
MKPRLLSPSLNFNEFCHSLVHKSPGAIIYADVGGMIRFWNRGAERIFGFSEEEALERSPYQAGNTHRNGSRAGVVLGDLADQAAPKVRVNAMAPGPTLPSCLQSAEDCARRVHAV